MPLIVGIKLNKTFINNIIFLYIFGLIYIILAFFAYKKSYYLSEVKLPISIINEFFKSNIIYSIKDISFESKYEKIFFMVAIEYFIIYLLILCLSVCLYNLHFGKILFFNTKISKFSILINILIFCFGAYFFTLISPIYIISVLYIYVKLPYEIFIIFSFYYISTSYLFILLSFENIFILVKNMTKNI